MADPVEHRDLAHLLQVLPPVSAEWTETHHQLTALTTAIVVRYKNFVIVTDCDCLGCFRISDKIFMSETLSHSFEQLPFRDECC